MKDFRLIEEKAMKLGIIDKDYDTDSLFHKYKKITNNGEEKDETFSDNFIEQMVKMGKKIGFENTLYHLLENDIINEDDGIYLKNTLFSEYLQEELERKNLIKKTKNKLF